MIKCMLLISVFLSSIYTVTNNRDPYIYPLLKSLWCFLYLLMLFNSIIKIFLCCKRTSNLILYNASICNNACSINSRFFSVISLLRLLPFLSVYTFQAKWNIILIKPVTHVKPITLFFFWLYGKVIM